MFSAGGKNLPRRTDMTDSALWNSGFVQASSTLNASDSRAES